MISLSAVVSIIVYLLVAAAIFALLYWLINIVGGLFPGEASQLFVKVARVVLAVLAVLVLIGMLLHFTGGSPLFIP